MPNRPLSRWLFRTRSSPTISQQTDPDSTESRGPKRFSIVSIAEISRQFSSGRFSVTSLNESSKSETDLNDATNNGNASGAGVVVDDNETGPPTPGPAESEDDRKPAADETHDQREDSNLS